MGVAGSSVCSVECLGKLAIYMLLGAEIILLLGVFAKKCSPMKNKMFTVLFLCVCAHARTRNAPALLCPCIWRTEVGVGVFVDH